MSSSLSDLGLLRIGDYQIALHASILQEVVIRPTSTPLSDPGPFATGTLRFGGTLLPAMDVLPLITGNPAAPQPRSYIALVRCNDLFLGLEVDEIRKFVHPAERELSSLSMHVGADPSMPPLFPQQFWDDESGGAIGVLDVEALVRRPGIRFSRNAQGRVASATSASEEFIHLALFKVHGRTFAVEVPYVRQALFGEKITLAENMGSVLHGHYLTPEQQTPILRLTEFLGLPCLGGDVNPERGLIIGDPSSATDSSSAALGFLIENVVGAIQAQISQLHSLAQSGMSRAHLYRGVVPTREHGYVVVLDGAALLAEMNTPPRSPESVKLEAGASISATVQEQRVSFLVYLAGGGTLASPLDQIEAVITLPDFFPMGRPGDSFLGVMPWRGHDVNLFEMASLVGRSGSPAHSPKDVLIFKEAESFYGFLVTKVESMTSTVPQPSPLLSRPELAPQLKGTKAELINQMIHIQNEKGRSNATVLDLKRLAEAMAAGCRLAIQLPVSKTKGD